jgi:glycolate oxidase iron-sulfur subunit
VTDPVIAPDGAHPGAVVPVRLGQHTAPSRDLTADCVHCGFCLSSCPTYALWGQETDSPRGRIHLAKMVQDGDVAIQDTASHFDACLGCMACVTACPSGVQYDKILEGVRAQIEQDVPRGRAERLFRALVFAVFPYPARLRVAALAGLAFQRLGLRTVLARLGVLRRLSPRLRAVETLLPPVRLRDVVGRVPEGTPATGTPRRRVGLVTGCVQRVFFHHVNEATVRVLAAEGCEVIAPRAQRCCGALSMHAGREPEALQRARALIDTFETLDVDTVVANVAGCGSTLKEYGDLLRDDPAYAARAAAFSSKVQDVTELLAELEPQSPRHPIDATVAYHDACHLAHAQNVRAEPRAVLRRIPGVRLVDVPEAEMCCGSAGIYNLVQPDAAEDLGKRKVANLLSTAPDLIATANPGCLMQIRRHLEHEIPILHPVQLVDAAIRGLDPRPPDWTSVQAPIIASAMSSSSSPSSWLTSAAASFTAPSVEM